MSRTLSEKGVGGGSRLYSTAVEEGRLQYMSSTQDGIDKMLSSMTSTSSPSALFEPDLSMAMAMAAAGHPCELVRVDGVRMPFYTISLPLKKGEKGYYP